jgi:hypothetical protein
MGSTMADLMARRQKERRDAYDSQWDEGRGSHHPDFDPTASGDGVVKASRCGSACAVALLEVLVGMQYGGRWRGLGGRGGVHLVWRRGHAVAQRKGCSQLR